jgi:hypothetical protein
MTIKESQTQLELLEQNNTLLRLLKETETNQEIRVLIADQIFNNQIQIGYFNCLIVIEQGFGAIEKRIDVSIK